MDMRDLFLAQHSAMQSANVAGNKASAVERVLNGLSEEQFRVRPREDLNSIAWILWHVARAEDIFLNPVLTGRSQVFDDAWMKKLNVSRRDFGIGMKSREVSDLTRAVKLDALGEYRNAGGKRTREILGGFQAGDWEGQVQQAGVDRALAEGGFPAPVAGAFAGRPRMMVLTGLALFHPAGHFGEATTIRSAGGFGTGI